MQGFGQRLALAMSVVIVCAAVCSARDVIVSTNDGRSIKGTLVSENDNAIILSISTVRFPVKRDIITDVEYLETTEEIFAAERSRLKDSDIEGRSVLVNELIKRDAIAMAITELESMMMVAPDNARLSNLHQALIERRDRVQFVALQDEPPKPPVKPEPPSDEKDKEKENLLTEKQINIIRVYEIDLKAKPAPNVDVPREVIDKLFAEYADNDNVPKGFKQQAEFRRLPGYKQLEVLFDARARPLYREVEVRRDPPSLATFRRKVHGTYVLNYCGAVECHGKADNDTGFTLVFDKRNREEVIYTNFYILTQSDNAAGIMLNRDDPEKSLLVQYGLDRRAAATPHPEVPGWKPEFRTTKMPQYINVVNWIDELWTPAPTYGLDFTLPGKQKADEDAKTEPGDDDDKNADEQPKADG